MLKSAEINRVIKIKGWGDKELKALITDAREGKFDNNVEMAGKINEMTQGNCEDEKDDG